MAKRNKPNLTPVSLEGYNLLNRDKHERVLLGVLGPQGQLVQKWNKNGKVLVVGLGLEAEAKDVLAAYDRAGGAIVLNGKKLETGCFWDFAKDAPREKPVLENAVKANAGGVKVETEEVADAQKREAERQVSPAAEELAKANKIDLEKVMKGSGWKKNENEVGRRSPLKCGINSYNS